MFEPNSRASKLLKEVRLTKKAILVWGEVRENPSMNSNFLAGALLQAIERSEEKLMSSIEYYFDHNRISVEEFELLRDLLMVYSDSHKK